MSRSVELGPVPADEECAQLGVDGDYHERARAECRRYAALLARIFPKRPEACRFTVKGNTHDFGTYFEVAVTYDPTDAASERFAFEVEGRTPRTWAEAEAWAEKGMALR
jgi:hypothetical protein